MSLSDTKLRTISNKNYSGTPELTDGDGLSVRITQKGTISFQFRYRWKGNPVRLTLGRYPALSLKDARIIVGEMRLLYSKGIDPKKFLTGDHSDITLHDCLSEWFDNYVTSNLRPRTQQLYNQTLIKTVKNQFTGIPLSSITAKDWVKYFSKLEKSNPKKAKAVFIQLKSAINWCINRQLIDTCSLDKISPKNIGMPPKVGDRVLTYNELAIIWIEIKNSRASMPVKLLHMLLMLYGSRLSELRLSTRSEFNLKDGIWTVPSEHSKMRNVIRRPIFEQAKPYIERVLSVFDDILFPSTIPTQIITDIGANKFIRAIRERTNIPDWRTHDFRRSLSTNLSSDGVMPHITEKMLGHELGGIMTVYNKHDWLNEQKEAYELYADKIFWHVKKIG